MALGNSSEEAIKTPDIVKKSQEKSDYSPDNLKKVRTGFESQDVDKDLVDTELDLALDEINPQKVGTNVKPIKTPDNLSDRDVHVAKNIRASAENIVKISQWEDKNPIARKMQEWIRNLMN